MSDEDTGDEAVVRKKLTKMELRIQEEHDEMYAILATYGGRAFLWRMLAQCETHHAAPGGTEAMARHAGRQDVGFWIEHEILTVSQEAYSLMRSEAVSRDTTDKSDSRGK